MTIYCKSKSSNKGCYYNFGVNDVYIDDGSSSESTSDESDTKKNNFLIYLFIIVFILVIGVGIYIIYHKYFKKSSIQQQIESLSVNSKQFTEEE